MRLAYTGECCDNEVDGQCVRSYTLLLEKSQLNRQKVLLLNIIRWRTFLPHTRANESDNYRLMTTTTAASFATAISSLEGMTATAT